MSEPNTIYVDWADLEAKLSQRDAASLDAQRSTPARAARRRVVTTVDDEVKHLRRNVRDSAKAVLSWVAALTEHDGPRNLNEVLDRCLRPGPDVQRLNYAALAEEIGQTLGVDISAKRVQTAVENLRRGGQRRVLQMERKSVKSSLDALHERLESNYEGLLASEASAGESLRRAIATEVLGAVRCAAGRLIESDYGEGIPKAVDVDHLEGQFLDFVRSVIKRKPDAGRASTLADDLHKLLLVLCDYDASGEYDMKLIVDGARVVADLMGPDSLPGLMAKLNVLVAGRTLLDSQLYCGELMRLADLAADLHEDAATKQYMNWVRRLPEEQRVPSPLRVSSYCLNNAATNIFERLFKDQLEDPDSWMQRATACVEQISQRDSGFRLLKITQLQHLVVSAKLSGDPSAAESHFKKLGRDGSLQVLEDMARFDNCVELLRASERHAVKVLPQLKHQLIHLS